MRNGWRAKRQGAERPGAKRLGEEVVWRRNDSDRQARIQSDRRDRVLCLSVLKPGCQSNIDMALDPVS